MTATVGRQIKLVLLTLTCILQAAHSSSVAVATSPIVTSITSTILSSSVDSVVTSYFTCYGCDDTSIICTTTGTISYCLANAVSGAEVTETIYDTNVLTRITVITTTIGFTTIYSDVVEVPASDTSTAAVLPASIDSSTTPASSEFQTDGTISSLTSRKGSFASASGTGTSATIDVGPASSASGTRTSTKFDVGPASTASGTGTSTKFDVGPASTATGNGDTSSPSSDGMSTVTKAALGAAIALGAILVGAGIFLLVKRRKNNSTKPAVAVMTEPSTDPEKYDGQPNRFFAKPASMGEQVSYIGEELPSPSTAVVAHGRDLDGRSGEKSSIQ